MKVLLTRRLADSERTAARLREAGFEPVLLPLFEIEATGRARPDGKPDFLIFTSASAVETADFGADGDVFKNLPAYAVGQSTARALAAKGYSNVRIGEGNASDLADLIETDYQDKTASALYVCGEVRAFDFEARFAKATISLFVWEVYRSRELNLANQLIEEALISLNDGIIMLFSPKSASRFFEIVDASGMSSRLGQCRFVAISDNCARAVPGEFQSRMVVANAPNEAAMIRAAGGISEQA